MTVAPPSCGERAIVRVASDRTNVADPRLCQYLIDPRLDSLFCFFYSLRLTLHDPTMTPFPKVDGGAAKQFEWKSGAHVDYYDWVDSPA